MKTGNIQTSRIAVILRAAIIGICMMVAGASHAERLKDLASIQGVRNNQLIGYGLVVGLDGTGDQTTQTPFTTQSIMSMLHRMGVTSLPGGSMQLKNVAAVMVTATLPPFSQPGQTLDVTVSSMGNAKSLRGGTLLMTPLKGVDGNVYGMAQGNLLVGSAGSAGSGGKAPVSHLSVGRIAAGATVERAVPSALGQGNLVHLELNDNNFSTASLVVEAINKRFGPDTAAAQNGRVIRVRVPASTDEKVNFLAALESINVTPADVQAKVILNARTGSVVMNQTVMLEPCAVAHGSLSVVIGADGKPAPLVATAGPPTEGRKEVPQQVLLLGKSASLADVVKALNAIGVTPQDLQAILQAMKVAGSLRAELEII